MSMFDERLKFDITSYYLLNQLGLNTTLFQDKSSKCRDIRQLMFKNVENGRD